jgi:hypothetical protein
MGHAVTPVLVSTKSPEAVIEFELIVRGAVPVFVNVTVFAALVVFSTWLPNAKFVGRSPTPGAEADPVPLRFTFWGLLTSLSVKTRVPVRNPVAAGVNVTVTVH